MLPVYKTKTRPLWKTAKLLSEEGGLLNTDQFNKINWENKFTVLAQKVNVKNEKREWNVKVGGGGES